MSQNVLDKTLRTEEDLAAVRTRRNVHVELASKASERIRQLLNKHITDMAANLINIQKTLDYKSHEGEYIEPYSHTADQKFVLTDGSERIVYGRGEYTYYALDQQYLRDADVLHKLLQLSRKVTHIYEVDLDAMMYDLDLYTDSEEISPMSPIPEELVKN